MFEKNFCTSPWFSMRIRANGNFEFCRWADDTETHNIREVGIRDYFQKYMSKKRKDLLQGKSPTGCHTCLTMEKHGKVSGRQKQLLKTGILYSNFKTLHSSTILQHLKHSQNHDGDTEMLPVDWQIDLGNYCNSACVMCRPEWSSKLQSEFHKLGLTTKKQDRFTWSEDQKYVSEFIDILRNTPHLRYLHFLGGETTIIPSFKKILNEIKSQCKEAIIGFTTNLTTWDDELIGILKNFKQVHVGVSIESLDELNDYVRWPSKIGKVKAILKKWLLISKQNNWIMSLRTTPSLISLPGVPKLYEFAYENKIGIESCNFLYEPDFLSLSALPIDLRKPVIKDLEKFLIDKADPVDSVINVRNPSFTSVTVLQDAKSLISYLKTEKYVNSNHGELTKYLKKIESNRKNSILNYLPSYEEFLRSIGY